MLLYFPEITILSRKHSICFFKKLILIFNSYCVRITFIIIKIKYNNAWILNDSNYEIKWDENIAYLSLIGEEQEDENLVIEFCHKKIASFRAKHNHSLPQEI